MGQNDKFVIIGIGLFILSVLLPIGLGYIYTMENAFIETTTIGEEGLFPATYTFTEDSNGDMGTDISFIDTIEQQDINTEARIIDSLDGHNKIMRILDINTSGYIEVRNNFTQQLYGTIEFWVRFNTTNGFWNIRLDILRFAMINGKWNYRYYDPDQWKLVPNVNDPQNNTWYHIRIDFRCYGGSEYLGLETYQSIYRVDSISSGIVSTGDSVSAVTQTRIFTNNAHDGAIWIDAIGYNWNNYNIGDNLNDITTQTRFTIDTEILEIAILVIVLMSVLGLITIFLKLKGR